MATQEEREKFYKAKAKGLLDYLATQPPEYGYESKSLAKDLYNSLAPVREPVNSIADFYNRPSLDTGVEVALNYADPSRAIKPLAMGMIAGPAVVRNAVKQSPTYAKKVTEYFDMLRGLPRNLFEAVDPTNRPGLYSGELFHRPEIQQGYDLTGIVPFPYTAVGNDSKRRFVYGLDQGRVRAKIENLDAVRDALTKGKGVSATSILDAPGTEMVDDTYPGWLGQYSMQLRDKTGSTNAMVGTGGMSYDPLRSIKGAITLDNPNTLAQHNLPFLDRFLNHEMTHGLMSRGGLPAGSNVNFFDENWSKRYGALPVGFGQMSPYEIYRNDLGEIAATASESLKPNVIENIKSVLGKPKGGKWGTDYPVIVRERLRHPLSGENYLFKNEHPNEDMTDLLRRLGIDY